MRKISLTPWQKRRPGWRKKNLSECMFSLSCHESRGSHRYCPKHMMAANESKNRRRALHRQLGFCLYCKEPAIPGFTRCPTHLKTTNKNNETWRRKKQAARGWVYKKVEV